MPSKLGPHSLYPTPDLSEFVQAGCRLVKLAGYFDPAEALRALRPEVLLSGRIFEEYDLVAEAESGLAPDEAAAQWVERQQIQYHQYPAITIWEGPHEPAIGDAHDPQQVARMAWYAAFEAERLRRLADLGLRGVVGNFATGMPDLPLWSAFFPALEAAERFNGYLGLHEYSSPWMWWLTGVYQPENYEGRSASNEGDTGWTTLRYRKVYRDYLAPNGFGQVPLIITECGLDAIGEISAGQSDGAWKAHKRFWKKHTGYGDPIPYWKRREKDPAEYYAEQLLWYDAELQKDDYVVAAAIFTVGTHSGWKQYDIAGTETARRLIAHIRENPSTSAPAATPSVSEAPPPIAEATPTELVAFQVPSGPETQPEPMANNLLSNAGFEEGHVYFSGDTRERAVPLGWVFSFSDATTPWLAGQTMPFGAPITALINSRAVIASERARIFAGGAYCWKIAGATAPIWVRLSQSVGNLLVGLGYQLAVNILPDLITRAEPTPSYASDSLTCEMRLAVNMGGQMVTSAWLNGLDAPFGKYNRLTLNFTPTVPAAEVVVEVRSRWPVPQGAWYIDEFSLKRV